MKCPIRSWYRTLGSANNLGWTELKYGKEEDSGVCWEHNEKWIKANIHPDYWGSS